MNNLLGLQISKIQFILPGGSTDERVVGGQEEHSASATAGMVPAAVLRNPRYLHKRRRLSRLLDKLTEQLANNNNFEPQPWLLPYEGEDAPLDLSVKHKPCSKPIEEVESGGFTCGACSQTFAVHDRLTKHIASRHRHRTPEADATRAFECAVCRRRFTRSDMLTRHARLHSGVKPYSCSACGQVFSRSDHLATHQRTHTGEKPYRCPACPYAACRRDMITRHMRTHLRHLQPA